MTIIPPDGKANKPQKREKRRSREIPVPQRNPSAASENFYAYRKIGISLHFFSLTAGTPPVTLGKRFALELIKYEAFPY